MKKYIAMAAVAMMFAACSNDDMPEVPAVDKLTDTPIMVNAGVADLVTRAGMTTDDLSDLGLFISNLSSDDAISSKYTFKNVEFEKDANGKFILVGSTIPLWQNETQKIQVQAYSPYNAAWTDINAVYSDFEVKTDQSTEANLKASDLLWTVAEVDPAASAQTGSIKYYAGALDITLEHICSKIIVNVRFGDEFPNMMIAKNGLSIDGLNPYGEIILASGSIGYHGYTKAAITAYKNGTATTGYDETFEAILIPQDALFSVKISLAGGRTFQWDSGSNFNFRSGRSYTLNLIVGKDKVEIADDGISVKDWNAGQNSGLETE